jgi:CspA family cold shock protein
MTQGTVKWFSDESGYGFIRPDEGGENLFVRRSAIASSAHESLKKGDRVYYEATRSGRGLQAASVSRRRCYSWLDDCLERHEGKEARQEYYAGL